MDKITIVITCYKEGMLLKRAFNNLENQSDRDFELIIINDASTHDETNEICRQLERKGARVIWHKKNMGLSGARNSGFEAMRGDICVVLDADDILPQDAISIIRKCFKEHPEADFVFGDYIRHNMETGVIKRIGCNVLCSSDGFLDPRKLIASWLFCGASPCRKSLWKRVGGYREQFSYDMQDMDFWKRALISGARGYYANSVIYEWHRSKSGMNYNVPDSKRNEEYRQNISFYEMFGDKMEERKSVISVYLALGNYAEAKRVARQITQDHFNLKIFVIAIASPKAIMWIYKIYRILKKVINQGS